MIGFDNWFVVKNIFGTDFSFSNAEIVNVIADGLAGTLTLELEVKDSVKSPPKKWKKWDSVYIKLAFMGVREISMFVNHKHICIQEFQARKTEMDFIYELDVQCGEHYIKCNYAIARIQNVKPLVWDGNLQYYVVSE